MLCGYKAFRIIFYNLYTEEWKLSSPNVEFLDNLAEYSSHLLIRRCRIKIEKINR